MFQTCRTALTQRLFQMEHTLIVHVVIEIHIHPRTGIRQEEPARLRQRKAGLLTISLLFGGVGGGFYQHRPDGERGFHQHLHGIHRETCLAGYLGYRHTVITVTQQVEDTEFHHQPRGLEDDGRPSYPLCFGLSLAGREMLFRICFF